MTSTNEEVTARLAQRWPSVTLIDTGHVIGLHIPIPDANPRWIVMVPTAEEQALTELEPLLDGIAKLLTELEPNGTDND